MKGAVRKSYDKLEPDSGKVKNNSPQFNYPARKIEGDSARSVQFNVSLHVRFIRVFILMPLLRQPHQRIISYAMHMRLY